MKDNRTIEKSELSRLVTEYGPLVALDMVIQGKSEDEARQMLTNVLEEENAKLRAEQAELKTRLATIERLQNGSISFAEGFDQLHPTDEEDAPPYESKNRLI